MANLDIITRLRNEAKAGLQGLKGDLQGVENAAGKADSKTKNFGSTLKSGIGIYTQAAAGLAVVGATFKKAFDFAEEGAQLELLESRFGRLATSIGSDAGAILAALDEATGGMMTTAEQMDAASQIISLGLADNQDDVVRLATLVSELGWDMQQVILTFANNSKARLDSLGLSVEDVESKMQKFIDQGKSMDEAFDLAVIEAGEEKLKLLGSAADTNAGAYQRLRVEIEEQIDALKRWLNDGLAPVIKVVTDDYGQATESQIDSNIEVAQSMEDLIEVGKGLSSTWRVLGGLGPAVTGTTDEIEQGMMDVARELAAAADSSEEFDAAMREAFTGGSRGLINEMIRQLGLTNEEFYEMVKAADLAARGGDALSVTLEELSRQGREANEMLQEQEGQLDEVALANLETARIIEDHLIRALKEEEVVIEETGEAWDGLADVVSSSVDAQLSATEELFEAYDALEEASGEYVTVYSDNSDEIAEISGQLAADLSNDQKDAYEDILDTVDEGNAEWLAAYEALQGDLTEAQRRELVAQLADMRGAHGEMQSIYTGDAAAAEAAQQRIDAAMEGITSEYQNMVIEITKARLSAIFAEDGEVTREELLTMELAVIDLREEMGLLSSDTAAAMREMAMNAGEAGETFDEMLDEFLADGELTEEELRELARASEEYSGRAQVAFEAVDASITNSQAVIRTMQQVGVEAFVAIRDKIGEIPEPIEDIKDQAQEFVDNGPYIADFDASTGATSQKIAALDAQVQALLNKLAGPGGPEPEGNGDGDGSSGGGSSSGGGGTTSTGGGGGIQPGLQEGGFTGHGSPFEIAGAVHREEFVFSRPAVQRLGVGNLERVHQAARASAGSAGDLGGDFVFNPTVHIDARGGSNTAEFEQIALQVLNKVAKDAEQRWRMRR